MKANTLEENNMLMKVTHEKMIENRPLSRKNTFIEQKMFK